MKTNFNVAVLCSILIFSACKKETAIDNANTDALKSFTAKSDAVINVAAGILPPVTFQTFIANGGTSTTEFQIVSSQHVLIDQLSFSAPESLVSSLVIPGVTGAGNQSGHINLNAVNFIDAGSGTTYQIQVDYNNVDSTTSGSVVQVSLDYVSYRTDDDVYHNLYVGNAGKAQSMCLVNNVPHILFQNPSGGTLSNGFKEIAEVKLSGDTSWSLNTLPVNLSIINGGSIPKSQLIVKTKGAVLNTQSDSIQLTVGETAQTAIRFVGGIKHSAGKTEILKIFVPVVNQTSTAILTTIGSFNSFVWTDALDAKILGAKNVKFFKDQTGKSEAHFN